MISDKGALEETWAQRFYREQIALLQANRIDDLIDRHYHPDATLISFQDVANGHNSLRSYFKKNMQALGKLEVTSVNHFAETADTLFFELSVLSNLGNAIVDEAFVVKDGKATHHFITVR